MKISYEDGNSGRLMVFFEDKLVEIMATPWKDSLVVKVLRLFLSFTAM